MITLHALQHAASDAGMPAYATGLGGNTVGLAATVDGVPMLISIGDGTDAVRDDDGITFGLDYADHPDRWHTVSDAGTDAAHVIGEAAAWLRDQIWHDGATARIEVNGSDDVLADADNWRADDVIMRPKCKQCGAFLYADRMTHPRRTVYRSEDTERVCRHAPHLTYWRRVDSIGA